MSYTVGSSFIELFWRALKPEQAWQAMSGMFQTFMTIAFLGLGVAGIILISHGGIVGLIPGLLLLGSGVVLFVRYGQDDA